jgi:hypothetical protein
VIGSSEGKIDAEREIERHILADSRWVRGAAWGSPRPGHPEGVVRLHIAEVLANIDALDLDAEDRRKLRIVALVHDTFKSEVDRASPRTGDNHHALIARRFAGRYTNDLDILEITELHDEAYYAWRSGARRGDWKRARRRAQRLIERLGSRLGLYLAFFRADNAAGDKQAEPLRWFEEVAGARARGAKG